jgi:hypothetical protein
LALGEALVHTDIDSQAGKLTARCWIAADADALVVEREDARTGVTQRWLELQTWRAQTAGTAGPGPIPITDHLKIDHQPDYRFAVMARIDGATSLVQGRWSTKPRPADSRRPLYRLGGRGGQPR